MPELPEVDAAAAVARRALVGTQLADVSTHHPSQRRTLPPRDAKRFVGRWVVRVDRRGKHQHIVFDDGAVLAVHFRMEGDWTVVDARAPLPRFTRVALTTTGGVRLCLVDSRALCTATYHAPDDPPKLLLGPEPDTLTAEQLRETLARRAGPIKPVLLDQRVVAGLGNIYAVEALWRARVHPAQSARTLGAQQIAALVRGIQAAIADGFARQARYRAGARDRPFRVYDREARPCVRCGADVQRITQSGRSTYFCADCQRAPLGRRARRAP